MKKLIEILACKLQKWPLPEFNYVVQEKDGELFFYKHRKDAKYSGEGIWFHSNHGSEYPEPSIFLPLASDWQTAVISRYEWSDARTAYLTTTLPYTGSQKMNANPWRRNRGRKTPPVPVGTPVDVKYRDGDTNYGTKAGVAGDSSGADPTMWAVDWQITGSKGDIMQWRYAEPQPGSPLQPTGEQEGDTKAFDPVALRDEYKRLTAETKELCQKLDDLVNRMDEINAALQGEGFTLL